MLFLQRINSRKKWQLDINLRHYIQITGSLLLITSTTNTIKITIWISLEKLGFLLYYIYQIGGQYKESVTKIKGRGKKYSLCGYKHYKPWESISTEATIVNYAHDFFELSLSFLFIYSNTGVCSLYKNMITIYSGTKLKSNGT